jgi:hypothetical protein
MDKYKQWLNIQRRHLAKEGSLMDQSVQAVVKYTKKTSSKVMVSMNQ